MREVMHLDVPRVSRWHSPCPGVALSHPASCMQTGLPQLDLTVLTRELLVSDMVITRATVYPSRAHRGFTEHRMWVADMSGGGGGDDSYAAAPPAADAAAPVAADSGAHGSAASPLKPNRVVLVAACARAGLQPRPKPLAPEERQPSGAVEFVVAEGSERWAVASSSSSNRTAAG